MGIRNLMFGATIALAVLGITLFIGRLPNDLDIDFVGGTAYGGKLTKGKTIQELRDLVDEKNQEKRSTRFDVRNSRQAHRSGYRRGFSLLRQPCGHK